MNRRTFLAAGAGLKMWKADPGEATPLDAPETALPGTTPLSEARHLASRMIDSTNEYLLAITAGSVNSRARLWNRNYDSPQKYEKSVAANREHLRKIIGAMDERLSVTALELDATTSTSAPTAATRQYKAYAVRWRVFEGVTAERVLLEPSGRAAARVVAVPDVDVSPEALVGLETGFDMKAQFARRFA